MTTRIFLGLGSNIGDRLTHLRAALEALAPQVELARVSSVYETAPWGPVEQDDFLNLVAEGTTSLEPAELLNYLKKIEEQIGRLPRERYGPREIDIDILFYNDLVVDEDGLRIPHPRLAERAFVLVPLAELAAQLVDPLSGQTIAGLVAKLDASGVRHYPQEEAVGKQVED